MSPGSKPPQLNEASVAARCSWATGRLMEQYHDEEWGVPVHDDRRHFEFLVLESAQAGLSWITILKRRAAYANAFCNFDPEVVAKMDGSDVDALLVDAGIIRNRRKVESAVSNARAFLEIRREFGTFDSYIWGFVDGLPIVNHWVEGAQIPAETALSKEVSADLRRRGFSFLGPVTCYAHLQATGLVMDHVRSCFRWSELGGEAR